jgi:hypothetical protein
MKIQGQETPKTEPFPLDEIQRAAIFAQIKRIQESPAFCNSPRAKEFLSYVVEHALEGQMDLLKERSIGVNLFHRAPAYITGDDPIVRVKAAEVRRRLAQFYAEEELATEPRIEIPVGSYIPKFQWPAETPPPLAPGTTPPVQQVPITRLQDSPRPKHGVRKIALVATALAILAIATAIAINKRGQHNSPLVDFWAPVFATGQPVLICLPSPVSYAISSRLYMKASRLHPGLYDTEPEQAVTPLQLEPDTPLKWKDVTPLPDYFANKDDAYVAADLMEFFGSIHKASQVRIGDDFTYQDLRNSPAVLVGAFDNPWAIRMTAELPIKFRESDGAILEQGGQGHVWHMVGDKNRGMKDFAIVARLLNSKTGQFLVIIGGIGMVGTQAAGAFASNQSDFIAALKAVPKGWQKKNLEVVLESDVIDASASPPRILAVKTW